MSVLSPWDLLVHAKRCGWERDEQTGPNVPRNLTGYPDASPLAKTAGESFPVTRDGSSRPEATVFRVFNSSREDSFKFQIAG